MHMMFGAVLHVTVLAIVGYFLLYTASKADGLVALIGRLLGLWVFLLAVLSVVFVIMMHVSGGKLLGMDMMHDHGFMHHWGAPPDGGPNPPPPAAAAPAAPAAPATPAAPPAKP